MNREEHLEWYKKRALEYVGNGDLNQAWASMVSDLRKHPETANHSAISLGTQMRVSGLLKTKSEMKDFIDGFN